MLAKVGLAKQRLSSTGVEINMEETPITELVDICLWERSGEILPLFVYKEH
jgi:hypothetical protein